MRVALCCLLLCHAAACDRGRPTPLGIVSVPTTASTGPQLLAAGDIAECGNVSSMRTAELLDRLIAQRGDGAESVVAPLGDNAYEHGTASEYRDCYDPTWGRHRARSRPAIGNHEYGTSHAQPYFDYFGAAAGARGKGWYSYELGTWHVVVLNSNCGHAGGCGPGSEQEKWLRADLAAHAGAGKCTVAYWHHPRFTSGQHGNDTDLAPFWSALYEHGAELVLSGHEHDYERFAPQSPDGKRDEARGIRAFVVGTGGRAARSFASEQPNSVMRQTSLLGVLALTLHDGSYDWRFVRVDGTNVDSGHGDCH